MSDRQDPGAPDGVAIVGMAGRFPGAGSVSQFWANIRNGVESITTFTDTELLAEGVDPNVLRDPDYVKVGAVIDRADEFDAAFFGYSPREADLTDPQQRVFLECAHEALESAGYDPKIFRGLIGVYGGLTFSSYLSHNVYPNRDRFPLGDLTTVVGNDKDYLTSRVSYKLDLRGPSIVVQSACSTSLVAVHMASEALLNGQCDMALAGGVSIESPQRAGYFYQKGGIRSADGHCRPFDASADGTVFGNGVGIVVLKRIDDAIADGDDIRAVIRGSAIGNDGAAKIGYTAPGVEGQARVIQEALAVAGVEASTIGYVEAHGTGTSLGDPIEVNALIRGFGAKVGGTGRCALGSVKANIGHLNSAAGIASLIKTVLMLEHGEIPPSINFQTLNPEIDFTGTPFYLNTGLAEWKSDAAPLRAGVSSFGVGGTNAHVILEEAPVRRSSSDSRTHQLVALSAKTMSALDTATANIVDHLTRHPDAPLSDVAFTLGIGRRALACRRAVVCKSTAEAADVLRSCDPKRVSTSRREANGRPVTFMFTGQGAQYVGMGRELYETEAAFRKDVDRCAALLRPHLGLDLREVLYATGDEATEAAARLTETALAQPALFTVEYAMARLLMSWGVQPTAMIGHSIGEYVAACLAGVFPLEQALRVVAIRGRLMNQLPPGVMLAVALPESDVQAFLTAEISLAAVNSPSLCVLSGAPEAMAALEQGLTQRGRRLHTSHAFHSAMMDPVLSEFATEVARLDLSAPRIPYVSNLTGTWITAEQAVDPRYWAQHLRSTVRFSDGVAELLKADDRILVEVGPGDTLTSLVRRRPDRTEGHAVIATARPVRDQRSDQAALLLAVGELWVGGVDVDWTSFYEGQVRQRVALPTYPFERQRFRLEPAPAIATGDSGYRRVATKVPAGSRPVDDWFSIPVWTSSMPSRQDSLAARTTPWLLFADSSEASREIERALRAQGQDVTVVRGGTECRFDGALASVRPDRPEDYAALLEVLDRTGRLPTDIVHAWTVEPPSVDATGNAAVQRLGFFSLLHLIQAIGRKVPTNQLRLVVLSSGIFSVVGDERLTPDKATILGLCRTIPHEYGNVSCRIVDIESTGRVSLSMSQGERLLAEVSSDRQDPIVAMRGTQRFVQSFQPVTLAPVDGHPRLRAQGVYLITGGWGGIGLVLARHLARAVAARLVMIGRTPLPSRDEWDNWMLAHPDDEATRRRILAAREIEALGGEVLPIGADVADESSMSAAVSHAVARFGAIHGVVHAAGIAGGGMIQLKDPKVAERVMAPKVAGTWALDRALTGVSLDWFVLYSSLYSVDSRMGQVDYCAANSFLDAFAHYRTLRDGVPTLSINWGGWLEIGMAAEAATRAGQSASSGKLALPDHPLLGEPVVQTSDQRAYRSRLTAATHWALAEHRVSGQATLPGTAYFEMVRAALPQTSRRTSIVFRDVVFTGLLTVAEGETREVYTVLDLDDNGYSFSVASRDVAGADGWSWQEHVRGWVGHADAADRLKQMEDVATLVDLGAAVPDHSRGLRAPAVGEDPRVSWGARWQSVNWVRTGNGEALLEIELPNEFSPDLTGMVLHPALLDVATGAASQYLNGDTRYLPVSYNCVRVFGPLPAKLLSHVRTTRPASAGAATLSYDVRILDVAGHVVVDIEGFTLARADSARNTPANRPPVASARRDRYERLATSTESGGSSAVGIRPDQGIDAFERILSLATVPQVVVSARPMNEAGPDGKALSPLHAPAPAGPDVAALPAPEVVGGAHARPDLETAYLAPRDETEKTLAAVWQDALGIERIGVDDNFFDLGGDSVIVIQIVAKSLKIGLALEPQQIFEHQTVASLAQAQRTAAAASATIQQPDSGSEAALGSADTDTADDFGWTGADMNEIAQALRNLGDGNKK